MDEKQANIVQAAKQDVAAKFGHLPRGLALMPPARLAKHVLDIVNEIAARDLEPQDPETWAGQEEIVSWAVERFAIAESTAKDLVAHAVSELLVAKRPEKGPQRQAAIARLTQMKRIVLSGATKKRTETTYVYEDEIGDDDQPTGRQIKKRVKETSRDPDMCKVVDSLLRIERVECELRGLLTDEGEADSSSLELLESLEEEESSDGTVKRKRKRSAAQKIRAGQATGVAKAAMERVAAQAVKSSVELVSPAEDVQPAADAASNGPDA